MPVSVSARRVSCSGWEEERKLKDLVGGFLCVAGLSLVLVSGCGVVRQGEDSSSAAGQGQQAAPETIEELPSAVDGTAFEGEYVWDDIPLYPGAVEVEKGEYWLVPSEARAFSDVEWLYYRLPATVIVGDVSLFYTTTMEELGWLEQLWYQEAQDTAVLEFRRNMRSDGLHLWVQARGEYTVFSLMRGWR